MAASGYEFLSVLRLTKVIQALQDVRDMPQQLQFLQRTPLTPAAEGEIIGRFIGRVLIADLIADDSAAGVYSSGKLSFENYQVPNLKIGRHLTQSQINQLAAFRAGQVQGENAFMDFAGPIVDGILLGIRQRMEALVVAMHIDQLSYDRLGFKAAGVTWGMPSDLKVTSAIPWTDPVNSTPVSDLLSLKLIGNIRYGIDYNHIDMSTAAFRYMIATTEFQNKAKLVLPMTITYTNLVLLNLPQQIAFATSVLGMQINLYDARYWTQDEQGILTSAPFLPINVVCLKDAGNFNQASVMDFANGIVTESIIMDLGLRPSAVIGELQGGMRGPISYATVPPDVNPPNITMWGVARGFPRKFMLQATAALTVGNFTDQIPVTEPFG